MSTPNEHTPDDALLLAVDDAEAKRRRAVIELAEARDEWAYAVEAAREGGHTLRELAERHEISHPTLLERLKSAKAARSATTTS